MADGPTIRRGKSKQVVGTPWSFIRVVEQRFGPLRWDLAATPENAKARLFLTPKENSLSVSWSALQGNLWLNPEYDPIEPWVEKCDIESGLGAKILCLVPASVGANWFREFVWRKALVLPLNGRITFEGSTDPYPRDLMLLAYGWPVGVEVWRWNPKDLV